MKRTLLTTAALAVILAVFANVNDRSSVIEEFDVDGWESSTNPPAGMTGAPGESNCTSCHTGSTFPAAGTVTVNFSGGTEYVPGMTYTIDISVPSGAKNGFEMTSFNSSDDFVGDFLAGTNSGTTVLGGNEYIRHTVSLGITSWSFDWVAPAVDEGDVTFYYSFNKSNAGGSSASDEIYLGTTVISSAAAGLMWTFSPPDTTIDCGESTHFTNTGQPSASTDCAGGGVTITYTDVIVADPPCVNDSTITRTWEVTDACANFETFDQIIMIRDTTGPVTVCPTDQVLMSGDGTGANILDYVPITSISDACSDYADLTINQTPPATTYLLIGPNVINIEAIDECANAADCDFTLHIYETADLTVVSTPNDTLVECSHSLDSALIGAPFATTTCPVTTISYDYIDVVTPGICVGQDTITRDWTISDVCGNTSSYTQIIITEDTDPPFIACTISDTTCNSTNGVNAFIGDYTATAATLDNCSSVTVTQWPPISSIQPVGVHDVWLFATDDCGNVDSCELSLVVGDTADWGVGLDENYKHQFRLFPNPTIDLFTIEIPNWSTVAQMNIYDAQGSIVFSANDLAPNSKNEMSLGKVGRGIYIVELRNSDYVLTKKLKLL